MSRFDAKEVNETWEIKKDESGRKVGSKVTEGRLVRVWVSDIKNDEGIFPVMGRYLMPVPKVEVVDGVLQETGKYWCTLSQYNKIYKDAGIATKKAGKLQIIQLAAKLIGKVMGGFTKLPLIRDLGEDVMDGLFQSAVEKMPSLGDMLGSLLKSDK